MRPIVRFVDQNVISQTVALTTVVRLSDHQQLEVLRRLDQFRQWHSLEEKRYCLVCDKIITGRQIQVAGGTRGNGALRLSCPTERCNSIPMDWVLPTDEILARMERLAAEEPKTQESKPVTGRNGKQRPVHSEKQRNDLVSRLRNFAFNFKAHS